MTARSTFFQQLLHTRWRIFEVFLMLLACFCVSNQQTVGQSIHSNPCSAGGHTWRISCFLRGHAPSDKVSISLTLLICIHLPNVVHFIWPHIYVLLLLLLPCCTTDFLQFPSTSCSFQFCCLFANRCSFGSMCGSHTYTGFLQFRFL